jgi:hypothetical protein
VQAWDRYAYANNNPVKYTDPTGHCIGCVLLASAVGYFAASFTLSALGFRPDYEGVLIASAVTVNQGSDTLVTAGIAVQSEYPWAIFKGGGAGPAQLTSAEMKSKEFGMEGEDPYSPSVAVAGMEKRIQNALDDCTSCSTGYDRLIVAAIAQNGPVKGLDNFGDLPTSNHTIDWETFFGDKDIGGSNSSLAQLRAGVRNER